MEIIRSGSPVNLTQATSGGAVSLVPGNLLGFYVNSTTAGTVVIRDGITSAGTAISGTITPAIGWKDFPAYCTTGCFIVCAGTGINITAVFAAG